MNYWYKYYYLFINVWLSLYDYLENIYTLVFSFIFSIHLKKLKKFLLNLIGFGYNFLIVSNLIISNYLSHFHYIQSNYHFNSKNCFLLLFLVHFIINHHLYLVKENLGKVLFFYHYLTSYLLVAVGMTLSFFFKKIWNLLYINKILNKNITCKII